MATKKQPHPMQERHKRTYSYSGGIAERSRIYIEAPSVGQYYENFKVFSLQEFCDMLDEIKESVTTTFETCPLLEKEIHLQTDGYNAGTIRFVGWQKLTDAEYKAKLKRREAARKGNKAKQERAKKEAEETLKKIAKGHPDLLAKALTSMVED